MYKSFDILHSRKVKNIHVNFLGDIIPMVFLFFLAIFENLVDRFWKAFMWTHRPDHFYSDCG